MSTNQHTEAQYENTLIALFQELGYAYECGYDVERAHGVSDTLCDRLQINQETSDASIQKEVLEVYGERYPDMSLNDWRHIIEDYTPMARKNIKDVDLEEDAKEIPLYYSKAAEDLEKPKDD